MMMLAFVLVCMVAGAKDPEVVDVSITGEGVGNGGRPTITATCSAKKANKVTDDDIRRCAVRGVLFKDGPTNPTLRPTMPPPTIRQSPAVPTVRP